MPAWAIAITTTTARLSTLARACERGVSIASSTDKPVYLPSEVGSVPASFPGTLLALALNWLTK